MEGNVNYSCFFIVFEIECLIFCYFQERGTGEIKLLHHPNNGTVRVVMRRDKTLKLCANHFITDDMQLNSHIGSDRAFNWTTPGDFADETTKQEFLAIKFGNTESKYFFPFLLFYNVF